MEKEVQTKKVPSERQLIYWKSMKGKIPKNISLLKISNKGRVFSDEHKYKISISNTGKKQSEETVTKRIAKLKGRKMSKETKLKISKGNMGKKRSLEIRQEQSKQRNGRRLSEETKQKIREASIRNGNKPPSYLGRRKLNPKTSEVRRLRSSLEYKLWRVAVFERDNYTCVWCGIKGGILNADHIKRFSDYPELRFAIDNGRTLCFECHKTTDTFGNKKQKYGK
jgi:5-methylcytosine-specific restriction endonuclease McrA